ncbi:MAG: NUDIX domain-containing protein [Bacteroidota bacterium]|nr:NUDIX domain-containing protein [Bacteroidota bacterium]
MAQNYKIFIRDVPLIISAGAEAFDRKHYLPTDWSVLHDLDKISPRSPRLSGYKGLLWPATSPEEVMEEIKGRLKLVKAAGGIVWNRDHKLLMIYRRGRWDLPKGKIEEEETVETAALREVEEESGVGKLRLLHLFEKSYHIYQEETRWTLKETFWYEMLSQDEGVPKPQVSEGITEVAWISRGDIAGKLINTYPNVRELVDGALVRGFTSYAYD